MLLSMSSSEAKEILVIAKLILVIIMSGGEIGNERELMNIRKKALDGVLFAGKDEVQKNRKPRSQKAQKEQSRRGRPRKFQ